MTPYAAFAAFLTPIIRAYIRYAPLALGKSWLYMKIASTHIIWRTYSATVKTRYGTKVEICLPDQIQTRIYFFGVWEPNISAFISQTLAPGDSFVDVGANIGYFSLLASRVVGPSGNIYAIEASPTIFSKLKRNVKLNQNQNIKLFNQAASDKTGTLDIFIAPQENLGATTTVAEVARRKGHALEAKVEARPLADIIGEDHLLAARLIKIDVEGAEMSVIQGVAQLLPKFSNMTEWIIEISPQAIEEAGKSAGELLSIFKNAGYHLYCISNNYSDEFYLRSFTPAPLVKIEGIPVQTVDVIATKRHLD